MGSCFCLQLYLNFRTIIGERGGYLFLQQKQAKEILSYLQGN